MAEKIDFESYKGPAGGWGSVQSLGRILKRSGAPVSAALVMSAQNKSGGFACVSCAWAKPGDPHIFEFCENGAKATAWELTADRATPAFFARHTVRELLGWSDHELEMTGRLTHPMRYDRESDTYVPVSWTAAFADIGRRLQECRPERTVFYASGRASLETAYLYALFARLYGHNNLPDSSNMCHESTSVALPKSIGVPVGTVKLDDFAKTDCIFFFGQNVGSNAPRMLHPLQEAARRGIPIVTFNPLRERGLERFTNPQSPAEMSTGQSTPISSQYHQLKAGGDVSALMGMCKALIEADDAAMALGEPGLLDHAFIDEHTADFEAFAQVVRAASWADIERTSGLAREALEAAATVFARARRVIAVYGMGLTQHRKGVEAVRMVANLLLLGGHIGREGAGICPVRGHSNVQGQRTVGITEKPELAPLDRLAELYRFEPPREKGLNTVEACEKLLAGELEAFIGLGGNFCRAVPEQAAIEAAWGGLGLSVQIATKLNRSHLVLGRTSYLLPCLGRIEIDRQASGPQAVTVEDSTGQFHGSRGLRTPASPDLLSELCIVAGIAKATLPPNPNVPWDAWAGDYGKVRDAIARTYPENFADFNSRAFAPNGFSRQIPARQRVWKTPNGKANFVVPAALDEDPDMPATADDVLTMITLRSNDQFNTTVYGYDDRFRGIRGTRMVVLMHPDDITRFGLEEGEAIGLRTVADDRLREMGGFKVVAYDIPPGCIGTYYPEANPLIPLWHHAEESKVPAAKSVPVRLFRTASLRPLR